MKKFEFFINKSSLDIFFPKYRIKTKVHIIEILMETTKYMLLNPEIKEENSFGKIVLIVDKMSRVFYFTKNKYYSISFPFFVEKLENEIKFGFKNIIEVESRLISQVLQIIKCDEFKEKCSLDFVAPICEFEENCDENFWSFLKDLLLMEDGYIRYDYDKDEYEKFKLKEEKNKHPLNHYDIFYSSINSFKLGLKKEISHEDFINILNTNKDCKYIEK
ncbi:hypothetical protein [Aliarcobacter cryaerophilus]|jgi:hypothetical protein|uniref:hypothetical protein n=1 Tax=Aliarcobacter cryaerophilus TaxID=28198 RepID=UPI003DA3FA3F